MLERISYSEGFPKECGSSQRTELTTAADDLISRQAAIRALWKALYEYEDKTKKQFINSEELDVADWIQHRIFVQNMSDIDRQTILGLPSVQTEQHYCRECKWSRCYIDVDKYGKSEIYWRCLIWDAETDEEGYCHEWKRKRS